MTWRLPAAAVAGLTAALAFPTPGFVPIAFVAWAPLLMALEGATVTQGIALGFAAGAVFFGVVLRWLAELSLPGWIAVWMYLALYVAAFGAIATRLWRGPRAAVLSLPAAWVALEALRSFGGFPGAEVGSALADDPRLLGAASAGGVALLSFAVMCCNLAVAAAVLAVRRGAAFEAVRATLVAAAVPAALLLFPASERATEAGLDVALIGGDTDPRIEAPDKAFGRALQGYVANTDRAFEAGRADLAIWPETALPHPIDETGLAIHARALRLRIDRHWKAPLLFGVPVAAGDDAFSNTAQLWSSRDAAMYRKRRLVPLGEYALELPLVGRLGKVLPGPDVAAGQGGAPFEVGGVRLGVLICFEDLFSADVLQRADESDALVILTNDVWLGEAGAAQHLAVARLRAVESGRSIARVANRGQTGIIDPQGRMQASALAPQRLPAAKGRTLYAAAPWLVPSFALAATLAALAASLRLRPSRESVDT